MGYFLSVRSLTLHSTFFGLGIRSAGIITTENNTTKNDNNITKKKAKKLKLKIPRTWKIINWATKDMPIMCNKIISLLNTS